MRGQDDMKAGDFSTLAQNYAKYRPDYAATILRALVRYTDSGGEDFRVVDVGAGTGLWTKMLADSGLSCVAVEPNDAMREEGIQYTRGSSVVWRAGSAEETGQNTASVDWVTMASSFHWVRQPDGLHEFARILKPGGYLTALWNPRQIEGNAFHEHIESIIYSIVPELMRASSGASRHAPDYSKVLTSTDDFTDVVFFEASHEVMMTKERYLGVWRSVNDIQVQAGPERFSRILDAIAAEIAHVDEIVVPYRTRAWTAQRVY